MSPEEKTQSSGADRVPRGCRESTGDKQAWVEPKLEFVEPKLTAHGDLQRVTAGFFGTFSP